MIKKRGNPALHYLDRYAGIPAVVMLGRIRRRRVLPSTIERIGLLSTAAIGDTVLISAVIQDLRSAFPCASLNLFAGETNFEIACMLDGLDHTISVPIVNLVAALKSIRSVPTDVLLDFGQWARFDALLAAHSRASFTIGFQTRGQHRHYAYDLAVEHSSEVHELENYRRLVRSLGVKTGNLPHLRTPSLSVYPVSHYAVIHAWPGGAMSHLKQWPSERWVRLIEDFADWGLITVLTGGPSDRSCNDALIELAPCSARGFVRNAAGATLQETAGMLAQARLVVSVNTGVMHMAAALGAPLVSLHGPTSSKRWGPISKNAVVVDSPLDGCGYLNLGWERPSRPLSCMKCIRYEVVRDASRALLEKNLGKLPIERSSRPLESAANGIAR
jgi:ADP-heptose:LPS heptosyltransferase